MSTNQIDHCCLFFFSFCCENLFFFSSSDIVCVLCYYDWNTRDLIPMCMSYSIMKQLPFWQATTTWLDYFSRSKIIAVRHSHRLHSILICILRWLGIFSEAPPSQRLVSMRNLKQWNFTETLLEATKMRDQCSFIAFVDLIQHYAGLIKNWLLKPKSN